MRDAALEPADLTLSIPNERLREPVAPGQPLRSQQPLWSIPVQRRRRLRRRRVSVEQPDSFVELLAGGTLGTQSGNGTVNGSDLRTSRRQVTVPVEQAGLHELHH